MKSKANIKMEKSEQIQQMKRRSLFLPVVVIIATLLMMLLVSELRAQKSEVYKPSGKLWGYAFSDFYYKLGSDTSVNWDDTEYAKVKKDFIGISIHRLYVGYDFNIAANITAHTLFEGSDAVLTNEGSRM
jgi:hypothetical protein